MHADRLQGPARPVRVSVAQQYRRRHDWRQDLLQRRRYLPCWLASFVLHMVLLILLASLILPQTNDPFLRPLLLSFATELVSKPQSQPQPVLIVRKELESGAGKSGAAAEVELAPEPPASPPPVEQPVVAAQEPAEIKTAADPTVLPANTDDPFAVPTVSRERPVRFVNASSQAATALARPSALDSGPQQALHDEIVDRFIEFDIGRLTGAAGIKARRDFESLGPDSIPALVRGLNRAASIHATCPVCVITSKLQAALSQNEDRSLFAYAVSNIGRDVPDNAPHRGRLMSFLDSLTESPEALLAALEEPDTRVRAKVLEQLLDQHGALKPKEKQLVAEALANLVADDPALSLAAHRVLAVFSAGQPGAPTERMLDESAEATARQWRIHWQRIAHWENLQRAAPHELHAALKSPDPTVRQAATHAIAGRKGRLTDGQKLLLARELIGLLSAPDALTRELSQQSLANLADQGRPQELSPEQWTGVWDNQERDKLVGPRANAYLSMAQRLEARGQMREAVDRYNRILAEFPQTLAAARARERLSQLAVNR